jgi:hypothetical protein
MTLWLERLMTGQYTGAGRVNADTSPCPAIMAGGIREGQYESVLARR